MSAHRSAAIRRGNASGRAVVALLVATALVVAACGAATSPSPSPSPSPAPSPSPSPSPSPAPSPSPSPSLSPSAAANPASAIKIDPPYATSAIDPFMENTMKELFASGTGGFGALFDFGGVQVNRDDKLAGFLFALGFVNDVDVPATEWGSFLGGVEGSMDTKFTKKDIDGTDVYFGTTASGSMAMMLLGGDIIFLVGQTPADTEGIVTAVVSANT